MRCAADRPDARQALDAYDHRCLTRSTGKCCEGNSFYVGCSGEGAKTLPPITGGSGEAIYFFRKFYACTIL